MQLDLITDLSVRYFNIFKKSWTKDIPNYRFTYTPNRVRKHPLLLMYVYNKQWENESENQDIQMQKGREFSFPQLLDPEDGSTTLLWNELNCSSAQSRRLACQQQWHCD